jgi:hypothetical protein
MICGIFQELSGQFEDLKNLSHKILYMQLQQALILILILYYVLHGRIIIS